MAFVYDALGNRTQMTDSSGTTNYEYNPFGELTAETKDDILKSYTYDSLGRRTEFGVMNGADNVIFNTYGYDSVGRLTSVTNGQDYVEYTYDGNSNLLTSSVNGVLKSENTYNVGNLPKVIRQYASGELQDTSTYVYNEDGTLYRSVTERATGEEQQLSYNYDYMGRMYSESVFTKDKNTGYVTTWLDYSISYDEYGNIDWEYRVDRMLNTELMVENTFDTANKITQTRVKDLKISDGDQYISDTAYTYNTNGAITAITENGELKKSFEYDGFGRLSRASVDGTESEYTYNGDNLRQTKSVDGALTTHILDGANVIADISDSGTKTFVRGNSLELLKTQGGSTKTYLNSYPRNDVSALVDSDGSTSDYIYTAYGEKIGTNDNKENPFGYCGEYFDTETGLVYLRNRYYDPTMHRFISEDPAKDGLNWYAYAGCNPTKYVDPWGLLMTISGTKEQKTAMFEQLQLLSDDKLEMDIDTGKVTYVPSDNVQRVKATSLVREIIDNDVECNIISSNDNNGHSKAKYNKQGELESVIIKFDTEINYEVWTIVDSENKAVLRKIPAFVSLGHELIHSVRSMQGITASSNIACGLYIAPMVPTGTIGRWFSPEELETTGINYAKVYYDTYNNIISAERIESSEFYYSENALRAEYDYVHRNDSGYVPPGRRCVY